MLAALYGLLASLLFLGTLVDAIGFVANVPLLPKTIDSGLPGPLLDVVLVTTALLGAFSVQRSAMARRSFKRWWTHFVPEPVQRSSFVLAASPALVLLWW